MEKSWASLYSQESVKILNFTKLIVHLFSRDRPEKPIQICRTNSPVEASRLGQFIISAAIYSQWMVKRLLLSMIFNDIYQAWIPFISIPEGLSLSGISISLELLSVSDEVPPPCPTTHNSTTFLLAFQKLPKHCKGHRTSYFFFTWETAD